MAPDGHSDHKTHTASIAEELAARIVATSWHQLTPLALRYAKLGLLDTIAVGIAGASEDASVIARRVAGSAPGPALLWGLKQRTSVLDAAFLNGIAANVLDFDDCTDNLGGHPSSPILPAALALAAQTGASGKELLLAYVTGFETETCLGRGVNFFHYEKGWHPTSTLGVFGAAAACSKLLRLDNAKTAHALALCASLAAGVKSNLGSMAKPMHIGNAARSGLLAAQLAAEGFTGIPDALEHGHGFLNLFNGSGNYNVERIFEKWGTPWDIEMPGIAIKQYPCCLSTQAAIDAMLAVTKQHDLKAADVARIEARASARRLEHTNRPAPRSALESKLSAQYVLARALADREVTLPHFEGDRYLEPSIKKLMKKVHLAPLDASTLESRGDFYADVAVTLNDGRRLTAEIERPVGHYAGIPLDDGLHRVKYLGCVQRSLSEAQIDALYATVQRIEDTDDIRELLQCVEPS